MSENRQNGRRPQQGRRPPTAPRPAGSAAMPSSAKSRRPASAPQAVHKANGSEGARRAATSANKPQRRRRVLPKLKLFSTRTGMDLTFFFLVLLLVAFGLVMVFSASYANASYYHSDPYQFVRNQAIFAVLGIVLMIWISFFDYHHLHKMALLILLVTTLLLGIVLVFKGTALVPKINEAYRWIVLGPINLQPSEVAKFALVLMCAHLISKQADRGKFNMLPILAVLLLLCGLVVAEKHMSATIILLLLAVVMLWVGGLKLRWFVGGGIVVAGALLVLSQLDLYGHVDTRFDVWLNPFDLSNPYTWQTRNSLYAIGSGQLLGLGLGNSRQKYMYLPEPQNDFIFAVVCEELGFVGALLVIVLFGVLIWRGVTIALRAKDRFGTLLGVGLTMQVGIQAALNIAVVTNLVPNTGISLPFFSYGGTSLVMLLAEMGVILSISRTASMEKT